MVAFRKGGRTVARMGRSTVDDVINEFVAEAREGIEAVDAKLVRFEQTPDDPELLGDIFRLIHSLKGGSGFLGLMRLQTVTHAAENVLGLYRDGTLAVDASSVSVILDAVDVVRAVIEGGRRRPAERRRGGDGRRRGRR